MQLYNMGVISQNSYGLTFGCLQLGGVGGSYAMDHTVTHVVAEAGYRFQQRFQIWY